ncbi:DUF3306 domain-containing protein [Yoonia sp. F2084L]|uniref:DUF3306 domain-containing protein n=1 Tax=Yoonia sp. F2084L TaxID=2926419 RepID=UPI001FF3A214|nr:DUF3306 domain-containing protein [Yoonia sp. F2084L]MCK0096061.1 DUF3306 domain-containing protein [Yoonia sp. F2084L]
MSDPEGTDSGRLKGWSQRKLAARREEKTVEDKNVVPDAAIPNLPVEDPDVVAVLPSLDDITAGFDISPFLAKGVPAHLKNAAMRRLWRASPAVRDYLDPAVDYAWDWNAPGGVPGGGGVLSEQSIAKMVKGIIGTQSEDTEEMNADDAAPEEAEPIEIAHQADPAPSAVRRDTPSKATPQKETDAQRPADDHAALPPGRRHGGAVPE